MSALLQAVTERGPSRSRNTLDDEEENEISQELKNQVIHEVIFKPLTIGTALPTKDIEVLLIAVGRELSLFSSTLFTNDCAKPIGSLCCNGVEAIVMEGKNILILQLRSSVVELDLYTWSDFIVSLPCLTPATNLILLDILSTSVFFSREEAQPPLLRSIGLKPQAVEKYGIKLLEPGNSLSGISASILSECVYSDKCNLALALVSLSEPRLEQETLYALIDPLLNILLDLNIDILKSASDIRREASQIEHVREYDRSYLYV